MRRCRRLAALRMAALTAVASVLTVGATTLPGAARHSEIAGQGFFNAVSCTAVRQCMAVGLRFTPAGYNTLAEQWTQTGWRVLATPNDPGTTDSALFAVACESAAGCVAVGYSGPWLLAELWNGRRWQRITPLTPGDVLSGGLFGVACQTRWGCVATGFGNTADSGGLPLAERWTGTIWQLLPAAGLPATLFPTSVSCTRPGCMVAGTVNQARTGHLVPSAEFWDGRRWHSSPMPAPRLDAAVQGVAVSCPAAAECLAVGPTGLNYGPLFADRWIRGTWHSLPLPRLPAFLQINGVWCAEVDACVAVAGRDGGTVSSAPIALTWNGRQWHRLRVPGPLTVSNQFEAVSCPRPNGCLAVGIVRTGRNKDARPLAEWWNGRSWRQLQLPL